MQMFLTEKREGFSLQRGCLVRREAHIIKEGCDISISFVDSVPKAGNFLGFDITCNECCLSATRRPRYPDNRPVSAAFYLLKESFPLRNPCKNGTGYFGYWRLFNYPMIPSAYCNPKKFKVLFVLF